MTTPQAALVEALRKLTAAVRATTADDWNCTSPHPTLMPALKEADAALAKAEAAQPVAPIIAARYRNSPTGRWTYTDHDIGSIEADGWREVTYLCDANAAPQPAEAAPKQEAGAEVRESAPVDPTGRTVDPAAWGRAERRVRPRLPEARGRFNDKFCSAARDARMGVGS